MCCVLVLWQQRTGIVVGACCDVAAAADCVRVMQSAAVSGDAWRIGIWSVLVVWQQRTCVCCWCLRKRGVVTWQQQNRQLLCWHEDVVC
jgi:hypothetical protein